MFGHAILSSWMLVILVAAVAVGGAALFAAGEPAGQEQEPKVVEPGREPGDPPADAIVLFDGRDLSEWVHTDGKKPRWKVEKGAVTVQKGTGSIMTKRKFGSCQLHIEWASPRKVEGEGQGRGNSGVFLQRKYEVQVLDSYNNKTYFHGQAGGIYQQYAPLVNVCRKPGEWQTYDIIFHAPKFNGDQMVESGDVTVLHNGVLIQDHRRLKGTTYHPPGKWIAHGKDSLELQDHGNPVQYRNIWIRELE